jgi:hypothetical protein
MGVSDNSVEQVVTTAPNQIDKGKNRRSLIIKAALIVAVPSVVYFGTNALVEIDRQAVERTMKLIDTRYQVEDVRQGPNGLRRIGHTFIVTVKGKEHKCSAVSDSTLEKREPFMCDDFEMIEPTKPV